LTYRGGGITFEEKALSCQRQGGLAVVVYNNEAGQFSGTLGEPTQVTIPVYSLSNEEGLQLLDLIKTGKAKIEEQKGYAYMSGTSMAVRNRLIFSQTIHAEGSKTHLIFYRFPTSLAQLQLFGGIVETAVASKLWIA
jgi:hypothetical protein